MNEVLIRFPIVCPVCGMDSLGGCRLMDIVNALFQSQPLGLTSHCHRECWQASDIELAQISDYLSAAILHRPGTSTQFNLGGTHLCVRFGGKPITIAPFAIADLSLE